MTTRARHHAKSRRFTLPTVIAGAIGSVLIAFSMTPSFAALTASIDNSTNTAGTGAIIMQETSGANTCNSTDGGSNGISNNAATCTTINAYGGNMAMTAGTVSTTTITVKNTGTLPASAFTLTPGSCTQSNNGSANGSASNLCAMYNISITTTSPVATIYSGTAAAMGTSAINLLGATIFNTSSVPAGTSYVFTVTATLSSSATDADQGLMISQPLTWQFSA